MRQFLTITAVLFSLLWTSNALAKSAMEKKTEKALIQAIEGRTALPDEAVITVRNLRPSDPALFRRAKILTSLVLPAGETGTGTVTAQVRVKSSRKSDSDTMLWVMARVDVQVPTLVTNHAISRGTLLSEEDLRTELRPMGRYLVHMDDIVGKSTRRTLKEGEPLSKTMLKTPTVVRRGDIVEAAVRGRAFVVQTKAEALGKGGVGETIRAKVLKTGKIVRARIKGPGEIHLFL